MKASVGVDVGRVRQRLRNIPRSTVRFLTGQATTPTTVDEIEEPVMKKGHIAKSIVMLAAGVAANACIAGVTVRPVIPDRLDVPLNEELALQVRAAGYQVYVCAPMSDSPRFEWTLQAPEADLFDSAGNKIGKHYAGPTWELNDGSKVAGRVVARADAPDHTAIPWLLLDATSNAGTGRLAGVSSIQRVNTTGGAPPSQPCNLEHANAEVKVPYAATYFFYAFDGKPLPWMILGGN
jgi:hypothetical protein